jgi:radical SAM superfamily enzyme YgiQ (UPF0313 family)
VHIYRGKAGRDFFELLSQYLPVDYQDTEDPVMDCRPAVHLIEKPRYGVITTSVGCPFNCSYCASGILTPCFRQKDYRTCFNEIFWMNKALGLKDIAFYDDALLFRAGAHFIPLLQKVCQNNLDIQFHTPNGLNVGEIAPEIARLLRESGFKTIRLGMETVRSGTERVIDNKASFEELVNAISALRNAGFQSSEIGVYLLSGLPGQTREEVEESMIRVKEAGARPYLSEFSPIPGTKIWGEAKKVSPYPIEAEPLFQNPSLSPCAPEGLTIERYQWRKSILSSLQS